MGHAPDENLPEVVASRPFELVPGSSEQALTDQEAVDGQPHGGAEDQYPVHYDTAPKPPADEQTAQLWLPAPPNSPNA